VLFRSFSGQDNALLGNAVSYAQDMGSIAVNGENSPTLRALYGAENAALAPATSEAGVMVEIMPDDVYSAKDDLNNSTSAVSAPAQPAAAPALNAMYGAENETGNYTMNTSWLFQKSNDEEIAKQMIPRFEEALLELANANVLDYDMVLYILGDFFISYDVYYSHSVHSSGIEIITASTYDDIFTVQLIFEMSTKLCVMGFITLPPSVPVSQNDIQLYMDSFIAYLGLGDIGITDFQELPNVGIFGSNAIEAQAKLIISNKAKASLICISERTEINAHNYFALYTYSALSDEEFMNQFYIPPPADSSSSLVSLYN
jgi:hypothetical protein